MSNVNIILNGKALNVPSGMSILEAAASQEIHIPTLCKIKERDPKANCRLCVVEVQGARTLLTACSTKVSEGMSIQTDSEKVKKSRKLTLELMMANHAVDCHHCLRIGSSKPQDLDPVFCEMCFFCDCVRDGFCELQSLARRYEVGALPFKIKSNHEPLDDSTGSIIRNPSKCIKCRRCIDVCGEVQTVHNLVAQGRGSDISIGPAMGKTMAESKCVQCGRCVMTCPTGAIYVAEHIDEVLYYTHDYETKTIVQLSAGVIGELALLFGLEEKDLRPDTLVAGLRKIGVDYVFWADDVLTICARKAQKIIDEALKKKSRPVMITNSYSTQKFLKEHFKDLYHKIHCYPSPQEVFKTTIVKSLIKNNKLRADKVKTIYISNTPENSGETAEKKYVDMSMSGRELYRIFLRTGVDLKKIAESKADKIEGLIEETNYSELLVDVPKTLGQEGVKQHLMINNLLCRTVSTTNLGQVRRLLEGVKNKTSSYDVIKLNS